MDIEKEKLNLQRNIFIPIDNIEFMGNYCEIYSMNSHIGNAPISERSGIIIYDTPELILNSLKWELIYQEIQQEIYELVQLMFVGKRIEITLSTFRRIYVRVEGVNKPIKLDCRYNGSNWEIFRV